MSTSFNSYPIMVRHITKEELENIKSILNEEKLEEAREINKSMLMVEKSPYNYSNVSPRFKHDPRIILATLEGYNKIVKAADEMLEYLTPNDRNYDWVISQKEAVLKQIEALNKILCPYLTAKKGTKRV